MGLRFKFLSGFLILAVLLLVAGAWSIYQMRDLGMSLQGVLDDNYRSISAGRNMIEALEREDSASLLLILGHWEEGRRILDSAGKSFEENLEAAGGNITIDGERERITSIREAYSRYRDLWARPIVDTAREGNLTWYTNEVNPAFFEVVNAVNGLIALNDQEMYETASDVKNRATRAVMPGIVAIIGALVLSLMFSYFVNFYFVNPLRRIIRGIGFYRETGAVFDVDISSRDEIGRLNDAVRGLCSQASAGKEK